MRARPGAMAELRVLLAAREPLYARAEITVVTSGKPPGELAREILDRLELPADGIPSTPAPPRARSSSRGRTRVRARLDPPRGGS